MTADADDADEHRLSSAGLRARVKAEGAELCALRDGTGRDYLWPASAPWLRHAPVLFPIVGRLKDDTLLHRGVAYRMTQHGFARDRRFDWAERGADSCRLVLVDDAQTRAMYPFAFRFEVAYAVTGETLAVTFRVTNTGDEILPASMGAHPAFRWPLVAGVPKTDHTLTFSANETAPLRGVAGGLLTAADVPSPVRDRRLDLAPGLFAHDALILEHPASNSVRYAAPGGPAITVSWEGFEQLGIWSRADADLLCIEPWRGMASPVDFSGEFATKPWLMLIPPGESASATHRIEVTPAAG
jgi:galactose mutarotase-like enzyme